MFMFLYSQGSGDSDLIGVEDNPDFGYVNGAFATDGRWENVRQFSTNELLRDDCARKCTFAITI